MKKLFVHGSYVGNTGYNQHTRDFFRHLSKHSKIKVRNLSWEALTFDLCIVVSNLLNRREKEL